MVLRALSVLQHFKRVILVLVVCLSAYSNLFGTHNRSGEITYVQLGPLTIRATITTYTKASSTAADRDSLLLNWGDGTSQNVARSNGSGDIIPGEDIKVNYYTAEHTYPGRATYTLSFEDPNRVNNIVNVNFPNSVDVPFFVSTTFTLINTQFQGFNNSVILLQPPIDFACLNQRFVHNPNAYDIDGDSLSYELVVPLQSEGTQVPAYQYPDQVSAGPGNTIFLDPETGDFIWDSPKQAGEYNIAIKINEYRNGVLLNSVIRDMQIRVQSCQSLPPLLEVEEEICVVAGETIDIPVFTDDPDQDQQVRINATGGPFLVDFSKALLTNEGKFADTPYSSRFIWETKCEHISNNFYQVVFRAQDNSINNLSGLAVLKTLKIKVVGPHPEDLQAEADLSSVNLSWELPYQCEETQNDYFIGFSVWRKLNTNPFEMDTCEAGLDGRGYSIVEFLTDESSDSRYRFTDTDVEKGKIYCYRVLANFAKQTISANPFNIVESLASEEVCIQLQQDIPLLTKVSVEQTSVNTGEVDLKWIKPKVGDFDTLQYPGPYRYQLLRSDDGVQFEEISGASFESINFADPVTLNFTDTGLNTQNIQYYYQVDFYAANSYYSSSPESSTVFLEIASSDKLNALRWQSETSWENYSYSIYRNNPTTSQFKLLDSTTLSNYFDRMVSNDTNYCYRIESRGTYGLEGTPQNIFNFSQETCGMPIDTVGPCTPVLSVSNPCSEGLSDVPEEDLLNYLNWTRSDFTCEDSGDIEFYNIYFSNSVNNEVELIEQLESSINSYEHLPDEGINGCYRISAVDSLGNEGPISDFICVDNCPIYILPNTFTPNGDEANEFFVPRENRFVAEVQFVVYNRWGNKVFESTDPEINWNGQDFSGRDLDQGSYYYTCRVFDIDNDGLLNQVDQLSGYIQLFR